MTIVLRAEMFARGAHAGQRHGHAPYWTHLNDVEDRIIAWGYEKDNALLAAAWLHDVIEDTPVTYQDLLCHFGYNIAEIVWAVTDELGRNREERKQKTYPKIFSLSSSTVLKMADLYDNVSKSIVRRDRLLQMYIKEWPMIFEVFERGLNNRAPDLLRELKELDIRIKEIG